MTRRKKGNPAVTPEDLEAKVNAYFAQCEAEDAFPDRANMIVYLDVPLDLYLKFEANEDDKYTLFSEVLKKARLKREGWLSRIMFSDKNRAQSAIFQLRQPVNGGYSDKQEDTGSMTIRLKIDGGSSDLLE